MSERTRCPVCGRGDLVDISFDGGSGDPGPAGSPSQRADSREVDVFSCGHEVPGASLATADRNRLSVETRTSDEPVGDPTPEEPTQHPVHPDR